MYTYRVFFLCLLGLYSLTGISNASQEEPVTKGTVLCPELTLTSGSIQNLQSNALQAGQIKAAGVQTAQLTADSACITNLAIVNLCYQNAPSSVCYNQVTTTDLCAQKGTVDNLCATNAQLNTVCSDSIVTNNLCVKQGLKQCSPYSARAILSTTIAYSLGQPLTFDTIVSDITNAITQNPTQYTTPESGNYIITVQVLQQNLTGTGLIIGTPIAALEIYVDGVLSRQQFVPYLAFANNQSALMTTLISLTKGSIVTTQYRVLVPATNVLGYIDYPGAVTLVGSPHLNLTSFLFIEYLSSDCTTLACAACQPAACAACPAC